MKTIVITIFLILSTLIDLRKKEVNISLCISVALVGLIYVIFIRVIARIMTADNLSVKQIYYLLYYEFYLEYFLC